MKLIDGIQYQGSPFYIPDCSRSELPQFFLELGFKIGAEIGVYKGKFCEKFCLVGIKMYAIDNWKAENPKQKARQDYLYAYTSGVVRRTRNGEVIRQSSLEAVKTFKPESLDFVYIDADHSFSGISEDLTAWYKVVKKGGVIAGHDYSYTGSDSRATLAFRQSCGVKAAVDDFVKTHNISSFYTFGRTKPIDLESKNDRYLSWMFFKPYESY